MAKLLKVINVDKDVVITNHYPTGLSRWGEWGEYECLNINAVDGDTTNGFVNAVFVFYTSQQCCEDFDVSYDERIFGEHHVEAIEIYEEESPEDAEEIYDIYGAMKVRVHTDVKTYEWRCYNDHNGYYGHSIDVEVSEDGVKTFEYSEIY